MDACFVAVAIYLALSVAILVLNRIVQRHRRVPGKESRDADPTGSGFAPHAAWSELDTYIARSQGDRPLH